MTHEPLMDDGSFPQYREPVRTGAVRLLSGFVAEMRNLTVFRPARWRFERGSVPVYAATLAIMLVLIAMLWAGQRYIAAVDRASDARLAESNAANLARAFEEHVRRTVDRVDTILMTLRTVFLDDEANFGRQCETWFRPLLGDPIFQIAVIGADGFLKFSNLPNSAPSVYLGDRPYFTGHQRSDRDDLLISPPLKGRISDKINLQFTRKILDRSGRFAGVMVISVPPSLFGDFYKSIDIGPGGVIALVGTDRVIRVRTSIAGDAPDIFHPLEPASRPYLDPAMPGSGLYYAPSVIDGIPRLTAYRRLATYPLIVLVQIAQSEIFAATNREASMLTGGAVFGTLLIMTGCGIVLRLLLRQRADAAALARSLTLNLQTEKEKTEAAEARVATKRRLIERQRRRVATISHEFRTPLTIIDGHAQYLLEAGPQSAGQAKPRLDAIRGSVKRILGLVEGLLLSDRIEDDLFDFQPARVDLVSLVAGLCRRYREALPDHEIGFSGSAIRLPMSGDAALLQYAFDNLLANAGKNAPPGSKIAVETGAEDGFAVIVVRDQGIGIPEGEIAHLFERHFRASNAYRFPGNGLGLYLARTIVERHGGTLTAESVLGAGASFTVRLPLAPSPDQESSGHDCPPAVH